MLRKQATERKMKEKDSYNKSLLELHENMIIAQSRLPQAKKMTNAPKKNFIRNNIKNTVLPQIANRYMGVLPTNGRIDTGNFNEVQYFESSRNRKYNSLNATANLGNSTSYLPTTTMDPD